MKFQSTHPSWGATFSRFYFKKGRRNFNPRTHRGVRLGIGKNIVQGIWFQSTHPSWGATRLAIYESVLSIISIHAPIVGCDNLDMSDSTKEKNFNPRTHRGVRLSVVDVLSQLKENFNPRTHRGVRRGTKQEMERLLKFQSTHPSWGATICSFNSFLDIAISIHAPIVGCDGFNGFSVNGLVYFNPRTHRGVRQLFVVWAHRLLNISIHAPIVGCDLGGSQSRHWSLIFQSTHPSWGATIPSTSRTRSSWISIHAPIVGCDKNVGTFLLIFSYFNPRTHRGVRQYTLDTTPYTTKISIHAPIVGCDSIAIFKIPTTTDFNPRTHRGVRRKEIKELKTAYIFQSTHPSWGATMLINQLCFHRVISIHAPIVGCDTGEKIAVS